MGILGAPDAELVDLLGAIEEIQQRARRPIRRGAAGAEIFAAAHELVAATGPFSTQPSGPWPVGCFSALLTRPVSIQIWALRSRLEKQPKLTYGDVTIICETVPLGFFLHRESDFLQHLLGAMVSGIGCRKPAVNRRMQKEFFEFRQCYAIANSCFHVHSKLCLTVKRD
jgi:hypothetical protein